jgi:hypothetical protein
MDKDSDALIEALRPLVARYGKARIKQALLEIKSPLRPGRPKLPEGIRGTSPRLDAHRRGGQSFHCWPIYQRYYRRPLSG